MIRNIFLAKLPSLFGGLYLILSILLASQGCSCANEKMNSTSTDDGDRITVKRVGGAFIVGDDKQGQASSFAEGLETYGKLYDHFPRGQQFIKQGRHVEAELEFETMIRGVDGKKDTGMGHQGLLDLYEATGAYVKAIAECEQIIAKHSADFARPEFQERLKELQALLEINEDQFLQFTSNKQELTSNIRGKLFYYLQGKTRQSMHIEDYPGAINFLEKSKAYISRDHEKAINAKKMSKIYEAKNDLKSELEQVELILKYSDSEHDKWEAGQRINIIKHQLNRK